MRMIVVSLLLLSATVSFSHAESKEERKFGVLRNPELYPQETPRQALGSLLQAVDKERYPYILAFLLDPVFVQEQMQITAPEFDKKAREQVEAEHLEKKGFDQDFIRKRTRDLATQMNFDNLVTRLRTKLGSDPESLKELRKLYREGTSTDMADTAVIEHPDLKDHKLFFRLVDRRWCLENKMQN